jgi:carbon monoxide dehydrogenase subunit G
MVMKAGVGSIKGLFNGSIKLDEIREPEHYKMIVEGKGSPGFLKGEGTIDLSDEGQETSVSYAGDVMVGGTLASVGQRMIQSTSKMMVGQFFTAIEAEAEAMAKAEESDEPFEPPKQGFIRNVIRQIKK